MTEKKIYKRPYIRDAYSKRVSVISEIGGESKTHQSFKDECDIKNIVNRYARGETTPQARGLAKYVDNPSMDFHEAINKAIEVQEAFESNTDPKQRSEYGDNAFAWLADQLTQKQSDSDENTTESDQIPAAADNQASVDTDPDNAQRNTSVQ